MKRKLKRNWQHFMFIMKHRFINALSIRSLRGGFRLLLLFSIVQMIIIAGFILKVQRDSEIIDSRDQQIVELTNERNYYITSCANLENTLMGYVDISETLDETNKQLVADNLEINEELNEFREREELYDKYGFFIYDKRGERNDLSYDRLRTLEDLVADSCVPSPDLILAIIYHESSGRAEAYNPNSSASGMGQFLPSTARSVWKNILGNDPDDWDPEYIFDPDINLQMTVAYMDYLITKHGGPRAAMQQYSGGGGDGYIAALDMYLRHTDSGSFANIESMYREQLANSN